MKDDKTSKKKTSRNLVTGSHTFKDVKSHLNDHLGDLLKAETAIKPKHQFVIDNEGVFLNTQDVKVVDKSAMKFS